MKDSTSNINDILSKAGADQQCVKDSDFYSQESSGSMRAQAEALFASISAEAKWAQSTMSEAKRQVGCGTLLVKATNILQKQKAMQCIISKCSQNTNVTVGANAQIQIRTLPLTEQQSNNLAKIESEYMQMEERSNTNFTKQIAALATANVNQSIVNSMINFQEKLNSTRAFALEKLLSPYKRDITIKNSRLSSSAVGKAMIQVSLTEDAQNKLTALSEGISKDVAELSIANTLGVNAQDPNVKDIVNKNTNQSSTTASSSIRETSQTTISSTSSSSLIVIECNGNVDISNTVIDSNAVATLMLSQMMQNAIANGLDVAAKTLSDDKEVKNILNSVKGLDAQQKAINEALKVGTENTLPSGGGGSTMLIGFVIFGVLLLFGGLYMLFGRGSSGPNIIIPQYKFDGNLSNPQNVFYIMVIAFLVLFLLALAIRRPSQNKYRDFKNDCASGGARLCSSEELCNQVKKERLQGVSYSAVSDNENNWVQYNDGLCKKHQQEPPNNQRLVSRCCPVHGTPTQMPSQMPSQQQIR